jgi:outer membrane receptor for ferrienterochelin and colicin
MKKIVLLSCFWTLYGMQGLQAQIDTARNQMFQIEAEDLLRLPVRTDEQVSTASNIIRDAAKQPASVTVISQEQIKYSGARNVSELLTLFVPGFFVVEDQDDIIAGFRGMAPDNNSKVLLLLNGQNLNTEFFWGPPDALLNGTDMNYIERIEVIRGSGSVTLGQGALLGVINIITQDATKESQYPVKVGFSGGLDAYFQTNMALRFNIKSVKNYTYLAGLGYEGQTFRNEGWANLQGNQGFAGGKVFDMNHRLRRANGFSLVSNTQYKNLQINVFRFLQKRDLYNFYRDREVLEQDITGVNLAYTANLSNQISHKTEISLIDDNYSLASLTGTVMGGTAEKRLGAKTLFMFDKLIKNNRLAVGVEYRLFAMGRKNKENNNYIANVINTFNPATANQELTMGYRQEIGLLSVFAEDFYSITSKLDAFLAFRFDQHPYWGRNISPRFGLIYTPLPALSVRASYQSGFRGAVGLHYTGGYRRDGFLRADNYSKVSESNIPNERNIDAIVPERINNIELSIRYTPLQNLTFQTVGFYNTVSNVIDVGVIYQDPNVFPMVNVGSDVAGDWNGYWYFKNTKGTFSQIGAETTLAYQTSAWGASLSHSVVKVASATATQRELARNTNSMYLAIDADSSLHYKAFPEMITRSHLWVKPTKNVHLSCNILHYSAWYSPIGTVAQGGWVANIGAGYNFNNRFELHFLMKNIFNNTRLYPMNSNAGGPDVSPGTPAWETRSFWLRGVFSLGATQMR